jgi:LPXTG-motif cell wall-anchored protein
LAFTGADIAAMTGVGAIALALGGMLVFAGRRRRVTSSHS